MEGLSNIKEDFAKSVENLELGLRLNVEMRKNDPIKKEVLIGINLESAFGISIR